MLPWRPARSDRPELMDLPGHDPAVLDDNLDDLRRVNRWLGGAKLTLRGLDRLVVGPEPASGILDVGAGGADIAATCAEWLRRRSTTGLVVASDVSAEILGLAARRTRGPGLAFAVCDGASLPFADRAFDVAVCSLMLHHLSPEGVVRVLREMGRVSRVGVVVNDIVRWWPGVAGAWLLSHVFSRNALTRHDGPLSVRRAYTCAELRGLIAAAGLSVRSLDGYLGYRVAVTATV